jgi:type VI secretion system protein ImpA
VPDLRETIFDIPELLQPIGCDANAKVATGSTVVCGDPLAYSRRLRGKLLELRKPEAPIDDEDTSYRRFADWQEILDLSSQALTCETKDLRIVGHMIEAVTQLNGFDGLAQGLRLLSEFIDACWDSCNPLIEDGDVEARTAPLENMLNDPQRGFVFPTTLRNIPLLGNETISCSCVEHRALIADQCKANRQTLESIRQATPAGQLERISDAIDSSLANLCEVKSKLVSLLGADAPGFTHLVASLEDCRSVVRRYLPPPSAGNNSTNPSEDIASPVATSPNTDGQEYTTQPAPHHDPDGSIGSHAIVASTEQARQAAYQQLAAAADLLKHIEPHSPIPYLVYRAVELGQLPFPELVTHIVRDDGILNELYREFGIESKT